MILSRHCWVSSRVTGKALSINGLCGHWGTLWHELSESGKSISASPQNEIPTLLTHSWMWRTASHHIHLRSSITSSKRPPESVAAPWGWRPCLPVWLTVFVPSVYFERCLIHSRITGLEVACQGHLDSKCQSWESTRVKGSDLSLSVEWGFGLRLWCRWNCDSEVCPPVGGACLSTSTPFH